MKSLLSFFATAQRLAAQGERILGFTLTSPEFEPPEKLKKLIQKVYKFSFPYAPSGGDLELREKIAEYYNFLWRKGFTKDNVFVGSGGKEIIFILLTYFLRKKNGKKEVIIISPYWASYPKMVDLLGGKKIFVKTSEKKNFNLEIEKIEKAITNKTSIVIINNPCNPTGRIIPEEKIKKLISLAKKRNIFFLFEEVYENYNYEEKSLSALKYFDKNIFCLFSASKDFSLCGWRIGWGIGDKKIIKKLINIQSEITTSPNALCQLALKELFKNQKRLKNI